MAHYNFNKDISEGEEGELTVIEHLKKLGAIPLHQNKDNRYDVLVEKNGKNIRYEIKTDVFCKPDYDTGNIFVEVECRGKASGIMVTEAEWFVTYYKHLEEIWYIKTQDMLDLIEANKQNLVFKNFSGDQGSETKGWLIPRWRFTEAFKVYDSKTFNKKTEIELQI